MKKTRASKMLSFVFSKFRLFGSFNRKDATDPESRTSKSSNFMKFFNLLKFPIDYTV